VEGVWASAGLIAAYDDRADPAYLESVLRWYDCQLNKIGFQQVGGGLAANYYSHSRMVVPNVTTLVIRLAGALYSVLRDSSFLRLVGRMLRFIECAQTDRGELPYALPTRPHFMCYQYNAYQFLDLAHYHQSAGDQDALPVLENMASFLSTGMTERGSCRYDCSREVPEVNYWTAALAAALHRGHELELGDFRSLSERAYRHLLGRQRLDGAFDFSEEDYGILRDRRSYPRYLSMILYHIVCRAEQDAREYAPHVGATQRHQVATVVS
jgi:hypothetical protein